MQDTEAIAREKKTQEPKKPRNVRRLEKVQQEFLDKLVLQFFTERSIIEDPEGEEAAQWFDIYNRQWINHCKAFNTQKSPIKLVYEAFSKAVEYYTKMEKSQMKKNVEVNKSKDFNHWFRRSHPYLRFPFTAIWIEVTSLFNKDKVLHRWKNYYIKNIIDATN